MRKILAALLFSVGIIAAPFIAQAAPCSPSMTFTTGQTLTAPVLNSNPTTFSGCFNNIDYTNIGAAGLYASNLLPTNSSQATFGGGQNYTFPSNVIVTGGETTNGWINNGPATVTGALGVGSLASSGAISGPTGTFSGAVKQTVSGTTYTLPYDAQSTSGSTNTHMEHGTQVTGTYSGGFACATSQPFAKSFSSNPTVVGTLASGGSGGTVYPGALSTSALTICSFKSGANVGTETINWIVLGE